MTVQRENEFIVERDGAGCFQRGVRVRDVSTIRRADKTKGGLPDVYRRTWVGTHAGVGYEFECDADEMWTLIHAKETT